MFSGKQDVRRSSSSHALHHLPQPTIAGADQQEPQPNRVHLRGRLQVGRRDQRVQARSRQ